MLTVSLKKQLGDFALDVQWRSDAPIVALVGPSGAGKTLTLQCMAGLIVPALCVGMPLWTLCVGP